MKTRIVLSDSGLSVVDDLGREMPIAYDEVGAISVSALDLIERTLTCIALEHESGHVLELQSEMEGWDAALRRLPSRFGIPEPLWNEALRVLPDQDPITVFQRGE